MAKAQPFAAMRCAVSWFSGLPFNARTMSTRSLSLVTLQVNAEMADRRVQCVQSKYRANSPVRDVVDARLHSPVVPALMGTKSRATAQHQARCTLGIGLD